MDWPESASARRRSRSSHAPGADHREAPRGRDRDGTSAQRGPHRGVLYVRGTLRSRLRNAPAPCCSTSPTLEAPCRQLYLARQSPQPLPHLPYKASSSVSRPPYGPDTSGELLAGSALGAQCLVHARGEAHTEPASSLVLARDPLLAARTCFIVASVENATRARNTTPASLTPRDRAPGDTPLRL
jgi:hypothetical protein